MSKMLTPCMYASDTDLYTEEELDETEPLCALAIPEHIVRSFYNAYPELAEETASELGIPVEQATFEKWYNEVYTAESMTGLYYYAVKHGFQPVWEENDRVDVTVHSIYDNVENKNINFGLDEEGYDKCMFALESSDKYVDEERYEYFGVDMPLRFVWRMTPKGFDNIRHKVASEDIFAEIHVGTIKVEIKCSGGGHDPDNVQPIDQTFVWGVSDPEYGYEWQGTPYKYLDDVGIDIPVRRSRKGFKTAFEQSFINFLNKHPEWIEEALKETLVDEWY